MSLYVAAYDIGHDRRRRRVARVLEDYGHREQESVFVVNVAPDDLDDLRRQLGEHLSKDDSFDLYPVGERGSRRHWRWWRPVDDQAPVVFA